MAETEQTVKPDDALSGMDATRCDGGCGRPVYEQATVDIVAGRKLGTWNEPERHVGVTGIDALTPEEQQYCVECAKQAGFDVTKPAGERPVHEVNTLITPSNLTSFLLGILLVGVLLVAL